MSCRVDGIVWHGDLVKVVQFIGGMCRAGSTGSCGHGDLVKVVQFIGGMCRAGSTGSCGTVIW